MPRKYTLHDFIRDFYTPEQCLDFLARLRWPDGVFCAKCARVTKHHLRPSQKAFACQFCGTLRTPTKGTPFHGSKIALPNWFYVVFQFAKTRTGIAAKQIERELGISYPTALRMCNAIRAALGEAPPEKLSGTVEADETYMGNSRRYFGRKRKPGRGAGKPPVFGIVERGGRVHAVTVPNVKRETVFPIIKAHVQEGTEIHTDEYAVYKTLSGEGYGHVRVKHKTREYVRYREDGSPIHTNTLEGFWSYPKNAVNGVHRGVSAHKLQGYLNEYAFRYSHRKDEEPMFFTVLRRLAPVEAPVAPLAP
jgi:transposase-like protein